VALIDKMFVSIMSRQAGKLQVGVPKNVFFTNTSQLTCI